MKRRTQRTLPLGMSGVMSYAAAGNLLTRTDFNGKTTGYMYDSMNRLRGRGCLRLSTASCCRRARATTYSYDDVGNLAGVLYPNSVQSTYSYDMLNRLTNLAATKGGTLASYAYTLGPAGNRLTLTEGTGRQVGYSYDALYRLTGETIADDPAGANGAATYTLDAVGNRLSRNSTLSAVPSTTNTYDANDRQDGNTYDLNGSPTAADGKTYAYDFENRLKQGGGVSVVYDGDGNRVAMSVGGVTTKYLVDTVNPTGLPQVLEELVGGAVQRVYTYGTSRISQSQFLNNTWTTSFYGYDGQGSVRYLTDGSGAITDRYTYDAFGNQLAVSGTTPNVYRYVGEPFDQVLQMTYLRARYMHPASGRFWTGDAAEGNLFDPPSLHKYLYASGDPMNRSDPLGLFTMGQGTEVHKWIGLDFMADGLAKGAWGRRSGTGKGAVSLGKILYGRMWSPAMYGFDGSRSFPDLVDVNDHFMFEIKTRNDRAEGVEDLNYYLRLANKYDPFARGLLGGQPYTWRPGTEADFDPFPVVFCDTTMTCLAFVDRPDPAGVITYSEMDLRPMLLTIAVVGVLCLVGYALMAPLIVGLTELVATMGAAVSAWATAAAAEIALGEPLFAY